MERGKMMQIDRYSSPEALALVSGAPETVCRLVFALGRDREGIRRIRGAEHLPNLCRQRHAIAWTARRHVGATFSQIGRALNRDGNGSTVVRSFNKAKLLRRQDPEFRRLCDELRKVLSPREVVRLKGRVRG